MEALKKPSVPTETEQEASQKARSFWYYAWRRFRRNKLAVTGLVVLTLIVLVTIFAAPLTKLTLGWGRDEFELTAIRAIPSARHPLGTDSVGRDILTRLLYGGQVSLTIAAVSVLSNMVIGTIIGSIAGYFGGLVDNLLMRLVDIITSLPFLPIALTLVAIFGPSVRNLIFAIILTGWPGPSRLVRGEFLSLRERDYVEAARATGAPARRIIFRHILPNAMPPLIVSATLGIAGIILAEAALSYLGFGVKVPTPSWGNLLSEANNIIVLTKMPWMWVPPGLMIFLTVLSVNFVGDGLRDAMDPRLKR
ncbi:MAG TPA: oligopeptide ABC transporter permease [Symbiobacteriaceae bacterium]|nr:oligopeptide ABC transporter permease [Symbiobacteriaceae bacterium]